MLGDILLPVGEYSLVLSFAFIHMLWKFALLGAKLVIIGNGEGHLCELPFSPAAALCLAY